MKIKFTLIDYLIIILVIVAVAFAFIHITTDDSSDLQKTAFDESTVNKIPDTYLKYYKDGYIVKATVEGFNSTTGNETTLNGTVVWEEDNGGNGVKLLLDSNNETYLVGLYRTVPNADIYIDHITLESNGEKYKDLCEVRVKPEEINSIKQLTDKIPNNTDYDLSTSVSLESLTAQDAQKILNLISSHSKREAIKTTNNDKNNELIIKKANEDNLKDVDSVLGNFNGITDEITIRIYDCTDSQINEITKNFDVITIRNF
ncbi:TrmB family transcriptional regulator sugar-binding domain-containing protein [Methanobrevibacter sp.]|uniref:TrmB family transcriptional regulator sugar-binding domain-containing protein n=1 Tax=Methanobrevibacter sp. TaxID=66852 RepID=UPI0038661CE6